MKGLIPVLACAVLVGCRTIALRYDEVRPGQSPEQVQGLLGEPGDKSSAGDREAWQYCIVATLSDDYFAVVFEDGVVARTQRYKTAGLVGGPCGGYKDVLTDPRAARREAARAARDAALSELDAPPAAPRTSRPAPALAAPAAVLPAPERESARADGAVYTRFNVHAADDVRDGAHSYTASYSGWVAPPGIGHIILPPNTKVSYMRWRSGFALKEVETGRVIRFEFDPERMRMDAAEYFRELTAEEPVTLAGLSPEDLQGIKEGVVSVGMSKKGVLTAYGIPAKHKTPSLDESVWFYWKNRFRTKAIGFDEKGLVREIKD